MAGRPWLHALAALLSLAFVPVAGEAQDAPARCPVRLHRTPIAERDSILRALQPDEIALTGFVRDEATGAPVAGITVTIDGSSRGTMTSEDGGYLIRFLNQSGDIPYPTMVRACELGWEYLTEVREVRLVTPWDGVVVVIDGSTMGNPGHAVRLDFVVRRRPGVF